MSTPTDNTAAAAPEDHEPAESNVTPLRPPAGQAPREESQAEEAPAESATEPETAAETPEEMTAEVVAEPDQQQLDQQEPEKTGWLSESQKEFLHEHKGTISLTFAAIVFSVSFIVPEGPRFWVRAFGEASLVGALVDYMAIKMLFEKYAMLPGSGVIPRNRERIIDGLAHSVENEWLTPESLKQHFANLDLAGLVRAGIDKIKDDDEILTMLLHQVSANGLSWVDNHQFLDFLAKKIRTKVGRLGHFAHNVGVVDFDEIAVDVAENIAHEIKRLPENEELHQLIRDELGKIGNQTGESMTVSVRIERIKGTIIDSVFGQLDGKIGDLVRDNLSNFTDEQIQEMFESKTRKHLEWIRVNGALYGGVFGVVLAAISRYFGSH